MKRPRLILILAVLIASIDSALAAVASLAVAGTYDILVCKEHDACSETDQVNAVAKGQVVLFATNLQKQDVDRFDENRFTYVPSREINGCFALTRIKTDEPTFIGIEAVGVFEWQAGPDGIMFDLYHSPDAAYVATVKSTATGLEGQGQSLGGGIGPGSNRIVSDRVVMHRKGDANISNCTFQTAQEHEQRRLLADPARQQLVSMDERYRASLLATLRASNNPLDWAVSGWMHWPGVEEEDELQILRARRAAPNDTLVRWISVNKVHVYAVPVIVNGVASGDMLRYRELDSVALTQLQKIEPRNAAPWLMALRDAVDRKDTSGIDNAMQHLASATYDDNHYADVLEALLGVYARYALPEEYFDVAQRLDPGWRIEGEFTTDVAPYFGNAYPLAGANYSFSPVSVSESGSYALFVVCTNQPNLSKTRLHQCVTAARLLLVRSTSRDRRELGFGLLNQLHQFDDADVDQIRALEWISSQYSDLISPRASNARQSIQDHVHFIEDWIATGDEVEAMRRVIQRHGKSTTPPPDWKLGNNDKNFDEGWSDSKTGRAGHLRGAQSR